MAPYIDALRFLLRRYPLQRGRSLILRNLLGNRVQIPEGHVVITRHGVTFRTHQDRMYEGLYVFGEYESENTRIFRSLIPKGGTVLDIGTNFGWFAILFSKWVGKNGSVHGFEPVPTLFDYAKDAQQLNSPLPQLAINNIGLSNKSGGTLTIHTFEGLPHGHASASDLGRSDAIAHVCAVDTLDEYVQKNQVGPIDFIKIDVEGYELFVMEGGRETLRVENAPVISFELNLECLRSLDIRPERLGHFLEEMGYSEFFRISKGQLERVSSKLEHRNGDFIAVKPLRREILNSLL